MVALEQHRWDLDQFQTYQIVCLLVSSVSAKGLAAVHVGINTGVDLVHHVVGVRASSVGCRAGTSVKSATTITVRIDTGIGSVGDARVMGAVSASGITMCASEAGSTATSVAGVYTSVAAGEAGVASRVTGVASWVAGVTDSLGTVTVRVDTGVSGVGHAGAVGTELALTSSVSTVSTVEACCASGAVASTAANLAVTSCAATNGVGVVPVRVNTGVGSVGNTRGVRAVGALRCAALVAVESLLNLVDDGRHVGWYLSLQMRKTLGYQVCLSVGLMSW
jgi:hypothetical protein